MTNPEFLETPLVQQGNRNWLEGHRFLSLAGRNLTKREDRMFFRDTEVCRTTRHLSFRLTYVPVFSISQKPVDCYSLVGRGLQKKLIKAVN